MATEHDIANTMVALHAEGVDMAQLGDIEAKLLTLLYRARRIRNAESMLPLLGADVAARRIGCHRSTVYRLAEKAREKVA